MSGTCDQAFDADINQLVVKLLKYLHKHFQHASMHQNQVWALIIYTYAKYRKYSGGGNNSQIYFQTPESLHDKEGEPGKLM